jgi:protein-disulfide isomerase
MKKKRSSAVFIIPGIIIACLVAGLFYWISPDASQQPSDEAVAAAFSRTHPATYGPEDAKVQITEFFDPACETCREFYPIVKDILRSNQGKVRVSMRYAAFHKGSDQVIRALEAARLQGRHRQALEAVLDAQPVWANHHNPDPELIWPELEKAGVDIVKARQDMNDPKITNILETDKADLVTLRVSQTPEFFVNGKPLPSFGEQQLRELVNAEVGKAYGM